MAFLRWYLQGVFKVVIVVLVPVVKAILVFVIELIVISVVKVIVISLVKVIVIIVVTRKLVLASCTYSSEELLSSQGPRFPAKFVILQRVKWVNQVTDVASCIGQSAISVGPADKLAIVPTCLNEARGEKRGGVLDGSMIWCTWRACH